LIEEAQERRAALGPQFEELRANDALTAAIEDAQLLEPEIPEAEPPESDDEPLFHTDWDHTEATDALLARRRYGDVD
jgi:hypothetical protein